MAIGKPNMSHIEAIITEKNNNTQFLQHAFWINNEGAHMHTELTERNETDILYQG